MRWFVRSKIYSNGVRSERGENRGETGGETEGETERHS